MDDEQARLREQERGMQAQQLLENPLWTEAWTALEARLMEAWRTSQTGMGERRELIYLQLRAADEIRGHIAEILETGKLAEIQLMERSTHGRATSSV